MLSYWVTLMGALTTIRNPACLRRLRPVIRVSAIVLTLFVPIVQFTPIRIAHGEASPPSLEINSYVDAHKRSVALQENFENLSKSLRKELAVGDVVSPEALERLREHKREYFDVREGLFTIAFLHASAIVERPQGHNPKQNLLQTSLSLMAGTDLVRNFQSVATTLSEHPAFRGVWNEADIEKTPFRLTDKFIPGHFGHVALYVGTEKQLHELGLLNHPFVTRYVKQVADGRTIVEALRDGTQINTVERFLNIDDLAILRPKEGSIPHADVRQAVALAFSHIGKKYDFAFDNNTWDAIVCSELAFQTYINVRWNFAKVLTSYTISPDDVAVFAGSDLSRPFDLVTFVHDGRVVHDRMTGMQNEELYIQFLGKRYISAIR